MKPIIFIFCFSLLIGCKDKSLEHKVEKLMERKIVLPHDIQPTFDGKKIPNMDLMNAEAKLVVWYDSVGCTTCRIKQIHQWYDIINYASEIGEKFKVVIILTPRESDHVEPLLRAFKYPVYIDREFKFITHNPDLPKEEVLHTFLLDRDNKIVMVGNPVQNEALWNLYKEQIQLLLRD